MEYELGISTFKKTPRDAGFFIFRLRAARLCHWPRLKKPLNGRPER